MVLPSSGIRIVSASAGAVAAGAGAVTSGVVSTLGDGVVEASHAVNPASSTKSRNFLSIIILDAQRKEDGTCAILFPLVLRYYTTTYCFGAFSFNTWLALTTASSTNFFTSLFGF